MSVYFNRKDELKEKAVSIIKSITRARGKPRTGLAKE